MIVCGPRLSHIIALSNAKISEQIKYDIQGGPYVRCHSAMCPKSKRKGLDCVL